VTHADDFIVASSHAGGSLPRRGAGAGAGSGFLATAAAAARRPARAAGGPEKARPSDGRATSARSSLSSDMAGAKERGDARGGRERGAGGSAAREARRRRQLQGGRKKNCDGS